MTLKPINRNFVVLADDPGETVDGGVVAPTPWKRNLDFFVVRGVGEGFGQGSRIILSDPMAGKRVRVDGTPLRIVKSSDIIGVVE